MNKKLNTIALATTLASLGFCGISHGWQTHGTSNVRAAIANSPLQVALPPIIERSDVPMTRPSAMLPPIINSENILEASEQNLPPIVAGRLIKQVSAESTSAPLQELPTYSGGGGLKPLSSIMDSDASRPPNVYRPPAPPASLKADVPPAPIARVAAAPQPLAPQGSGTRSIGGGSDIGSGGGSGTRSIGGGGSDTRSVLENSGQNFTGNSPSYNAPSGSDSRSYGDGYNQDPYTDQGGNAFDDSGNGNSNGGGCASCGNSLQDGSCPNCGPGAGGSDGPVIRDYGTFGSVSAANQYLYVDALVMTRADGDIANSNFGTLNDFDFTGGLRVTYGVRDDSIFGREVSFFGLPSLDQEISQVDPPGRINIGGIPNFAAPSTAFFNATAQTQSKESDLYSLEFNRVNWGWDLIKSFNGLRIIRFDDSYNVASTGSTPQLDGAGNVVFDANNQPVLSQGELTLDAANTLLGGQIGGELFYDTGYRWSASGYGKFGVFANFNDFDFDFRNDDFESSSESDDVTISTVAELGVLAHYQIRTNLRFRAGYNVTFIGNVASVADNLGQSAGLFNGFDSSDSDDVLFHGFNFGIELYR